MPKKQTKAEKAEKARREADEMYNLMAVELRMVGLELPARAQSKQVRTALSRAAPTLIPLRSLNALSATLSPAFLRRLDRRPSSRSSARR